MCLLDCNEKVIKEISENDNIASGELFKFHKIIPNAHIKDNKAEFLAIEIMDPNTQKSQSLKIKLIE